MPPFSFFQLWLARNWSARLVANEESFHHVASSTRSDSSGTARKTYWPPACGFQLPSIENERVERLNSFQNWWKTIAKTSLSRFPIIYAILPFFTWALLTVAMSHLSSASETLSVDKTYQNWPIKWYTRSWYTGTIFCQFQPQAFFRFPRCASTLSFRSPLSRYAPAIQHNKVCIIGSGTRIGKDFILGEVFFAFPFLHFPISHYLFCLKPPHPPPPSPKPKCSWE